MHETLDNLIFRFYPQCPRLYPGRVKQVEIVLQDIESMIPIGLFTGLQIVSLVNCNIVKIEGIQKLKLCQLCLNENNISQISGLKEQFKLKKLNLSNNRIKDLTPLLQLQSLQELWICQNQLQSLQGLGQLNKLKVLWAAGNHLSKLSNQLILLNSLEQLNLADNRIVDITEITQSAHKLCNLKILHLNHSLSGKNPVCAMPHYRHRLIFSFISLSVLDQRLIKKSQISKCKLPYLQMCQYSQLSLKKIQQTYHRCNQAIHQVQKSLINSQNLLWDHAFSQNINQQIIPILSIRNNRNLLLKQLINQLKSVVSAVYQQKNTWGLIQMDIATNKWYDFCQNLLQKSSYKAVLVLKYNNWFSIQAYQHFSQKKQQKWLFCKNIKNPIIFYSEVNRVASQSKIIWLYKIDTTRCNYVIQGQQYEQSQCICKVNQKNAQDQIYIVNDRNKKLAVLKLYLYHQQIDKSKSNYPQCVLQTVTNQILNSIKQQVKITTNIKLTTNPINDGLNLINRALNQVTLKANQFKKINLSFNNFNHLQKLSVLTYVQHISITSNPVPVHQITNIHNILPNLQTINYSKIQPDQKVSQNPSYLCLTSVPQLIHQQIIMLDLSYNCLKQIKGLSKYIHLSWLNLKSNHLTNINLLPRNLKTLIASQNHINELQFQLDHLIQLNLTQNQLTKQVIWQLAKLHSLLVLDILKNPISQHYGTRLQILCYLPQINILNGVKVQIYQVEKALQVHGTTLTQVILQQRAGQFPLGVTQLNLTDLRLKFSQQPIMQQQFKNLIKLNLCRNNLICLNILGKLPLLKYLDISHNKITQLVCQKGGLQNCIKLTHLIADNNRLQQIPMQLSSLILLSIRKNLIQTLNLINLPMLAETDFSENSIKRLHKQLIPKGHPLKKLLLNKNGLTSLFAIDIFQNLVQLQLSKNNLQDMAQLHLFSYLHDLKILLLSNNKYKLNIRKKVIQLLPKLIQFDGKQIIRRPQSEQRKALKIKQKV